MWSTDPEVLILGSVDRAFTLIVDDINRTRREEDVANQYQIKGLADALRSLKALAQNASALGADVQSTLAQGGDTVRTVTQLHGEVKSALAEVQGELSSLSNGGPPLDDAAFPPASPAAAAPASPASGTADPAVVATAAPVGAPGVPDAGRFLNPAPSK